MKAFTLSATVLLGVREKYDMDKKFRFLYRFYPEPTQMQKRLNLEALFAQQSLQQEREELFKIDPKTQRIYE